MCRSLGGKLPYLKLLDKKEASDTSNKQKIFISEATERVFLEVMDKNT